MNAIHDASALRLGTLHFQRGAFPSGDIMWNHCAYASFHEERCNFIDSSLEIAVQRWPTSLWIVRHGESAGNVARDTAYAAGATMIDIEARDIDVPLSGLGEKQAAALGSWFASLPNDRRPNAVLCSPYLRARSTAEAVRFAGGASDFSEIVIDEHLREKEFGILDRLTRLGIEQRHAELAAARQRIGKFYFRPFPPAKAGATSFCDSECFGYDKFTLRRQAGANRRASGRRPLHALLVGKSG